MKKRQLFKGLANKLSICGMVMIILSLLFILAGCGDKENNTNEDENAVNDIAYSIQYTDSEGNHTISVKYGEVYSLAELPQKTGYDFTGLFDMEEGGTQYVSATGNSLSPFCDNRNMTLFPQFKPKEYTLVLDYQGAEVTGTRQIKVAFDQFIKELPLDLTMENKKFMGWYTAPNREGIRIADRYGVDPMTGALDSKLISLADERGRICLYAGFKFEDVNLTLYIGDNTVPEEVAVEWGTHIAELRAETRINGKAVLTWSKIKNDTTLSNVFDGKITDDMVLYSCEYAPVIDFNSMGGEKLQSIINRAGNSVILPVAVRENYTFIGWFNLDGARFESTVMPNESISLYAKWQANIVFKENGGTSVDDITAPTGTTVALPIPERVGYMFAGWYDASGNKYESASMPESSIVLGAKYYKVKTEKHVLISESEYECNYGEMPKIVADNGYNNSYSNSLDLSHLYNSGVEYIKIYEHHCSSIDNTDTTYMSWYTQPTASNAHKIWGYSEKHQETKKYSQFTNSTVVTLTGGKLYIARWSNVEYYYNSSYHNYARWTDFWVEIEYPDMTTLY